jgi:hypothetical protein
MVNQRDAYREGYDTGNGIARMSIHNLKKWGRENFVHECLESEEHARQYSPFEFTAHEFNESRNPDGLWDAYEKGVYRGIIDVVKKAVAMTKKATPVKKRVTKKKSPRRK